MKRFVTLSALMVLAVIGVIAGAPAAETSYAQPPSTTAVEFHGHGGHGVYHGHGWYHY